MLKKRIIVCLDVRDGKVTKGIKFKNNKDIGSPVEFATRYYEQGVDELVLYDITASAEYRNIMLDVVKEVAHHIFIPFSVGGGIKNIDDMHALLMNGAEKVSVNSLAVLNPQIIDEGASQFGSQCIVVGMDVLKDSAMPCGYRIVIRGGRESTELDALGWAREVTSRGAGEIVLNSIDADGTQEGYDCQLVQLISSHVSVPVVASGGAGTPEHVVEVFKTGHADAALVASMVHYGHYDIPEIKRYVSNRHVAVRLDY